VADNLNMQSGNIYVPYWDATNKLVRYSLVAAGCLCDTTQSLDNFSFMVATMSWLNKCNPDWQKNVAGPVQTISGLTGEVTLLAQQVQSFSILITQTGGQSRWYNSNNIAQFGQASFSVGGIIRMPLLTIETTQSDFEGDGNSSYDGIYLNLLPGVIATVIIVQYPNAGTGNISTVPPVYAIGSGPQQSYPIPGNQTPTSARGPETLP
jgi:hypothetical protein